MTSKYSHECGLTNSIFVSRAIGNDTVLFNSNDPPPWWARAGVAKMIASHVSNRCRFMAYSQARRIHRRTFMTTVAARAESNARPNQWIVCLAG
jgi:hypothetical protein